MTITPLYTTGELAAALAIELPAGMDEAGSVSEISIDTRSLNPGALYIALKGERHDGHRFAADALEKGAAAVLVEEALPDISPSRQLVVADSLAALQALARWRRRNSPATVIGITGSVGKTSTKEMMAMAVGTQFRTYATQGNYNNHIGLPLTIVNAPADTEMLVLEMGMNHAGEIHVLSEIARPDIAMITAVEAVHLEFFDSVAGIARAKAEIMDGMSASSPIILPRDNPHYGLLEEIAHQQALEVVAFGTHAEAKYRLEDVSVGPLGTDASVALPDISLSLQLVAAGAQHAMNAVAVLACCDYLRLDLARAATALRGYRQPTGRGALHQLPWQDGMIRVMDETYNASPASVTSALATMAAVAGEGRRLVVLGEMLELGKDGPSLHAGLAPVCQEVGVARAFLYGPLMAYLAEALPSSVVAGHFLEHASLSEALAGEILPGDIILFKGSRGSRMEQIIATLEAQSATG